MNLKIDIANKTKNPVYFGLILAAAKESLEKSDLFALFKNKKINISLAIVRESEIKKLNRIYRKKNQSTDVLSFSEFGNPKEIRKMLKREKEIFLGEIILCYNDINKYCKKNKLTPLKAELARVVSHGVLHLSGMKHGKKMFTIQNAITEKIK